MYESQMSNHIKKYYRDMFGFALYLLYADRLIKELIGMGYPEFTLIPIKEHMKQDYEYLKLISK